MVRAFIFFSMWFVHGIVFAQELNAAHISTSGYGEVSVVPDAASFNVQVEQSNLNAEQAKNSVDTIVQNFINQLISLGASTDQVSSSNLFISPQYSYPKNGQPELIGYRAVRKVTVDVSNIGLLNSYLDAALEQGVTSVNRIELRVKDRDKYQRQATKAAIKNAQQNAEILAHGFNLQLGEVWEIRYRSQPVAPVPGLLRTMTLDQPSVFKDYQDTNIVIRDDVEVIYKLRSK